MTALPSDADLKMTIDEAITFAAEWSRGMTLHADSQGWRVVCMLLADEVVRLRARELDAGVGGELEQFLIRNLLTYLDVDGDDVFAHWKGERRSVKEMASEYLGRKE